MAIRNVTQRNALATAYGAAAPFGALFTGDPGILDAATNEVVGAAYNRVSMAWGAASASAITGVPVFTVPSGVTVSYFGVAVTGTKTTADVRDSFDVVDQAFASQGTYTVTATYTQS
jgi:hypothetical protein